MHLRSLALALLTLALAGCPQERPGSEREIPHERVPPAVSVEPPPGDAGPAQPASVRRAQ